MAKKLVRGITDIKEINKQDFDTNNVNDLLSDGEHNYIHRKKKDNSEEYHNLTNNLKTITSDNTDLIDVENDNNLTNSATLHPKHDSQKEQVIESANNTITIVNGENATNEKTRIKVSDELVETINNKQDKLTVGDGLLLSENKIVINPSNNGNPLTVNGFYKGSVLGDIQYSSIISLKTDNNKTMQLAFRESAVTPNLMIMRYRFVNNNIPTEWKLALIDQDTIINYLSQKQNILSSSTSVGLTSNNQLKQLFYYKKTYLHTNGMLITYVKSLAQNTNINVSQDEYHFTIKINKNAQSIVIDLNESDTNFFNSIITKYGENNTVRISGCVFTLNGTTLTVSTTNNTQQNYVITFSDII